MNKLLVTALAIFLVGCTRAPEAEHALRVNGYKDITITGYRFFACQHDTFHTGFAATAPNGEKVTGTVCSGFLTSSQIRVD